MKKQSGKTIDHISKDIEQLFYLRQENKQCIENALQFDNASQSEIEDRKRLAAEYDKMIQFRNIEREYLIVNYLDKYNGKFPYIPQEILSTLKDLISGMKMVENCFEDKEDFEKHWNKFISSL